MTDSSRDNDNGAELPDPTPDEDSPATFPVGPEDNRAPTLPVESDAGASQALTALLSLTPFLDLHDRARGDSAWRGRLCFTLDLVLRLITVGLLIALIVAVAWKVLAPLPPFCK